MARTYRLVVGSTEATERLDRYLVKHLPKTVSRGAVQRAIREGAITVEGRVAKAHRRLRGGEGVVARIDGFEMLTVSTVPARSGVSAAREGRRASAVHPRVETPTPEPMALDIVYEDRDLLVINKPPGLVTHPAPGHWSGTLVNAVAWHLGQRPHAGSQGSRTADRNDKAPSRSAASRLPRAGLLHRLDKDTSGLLVLAKTTRALTDLSKQLKSRVLRRRYVTLVEGEVAFDEGTIDVPIGRHLKERTRMAVRYLGGRQAITRYRVLARVRTGQIRPGSTQHSTRQRPTPTVPRYTVLELHLETGRTHQLRVHLAHLGHPVLGDVIYGRHTVRYWTSLGIARQLLHAYAIRLTHPATAEVLELRARIPKDVAAWIPMTAMKKLDRRAERAS